jgi:hypothetical protein
MTLWKRLARDAFLLSAATVGLTAPSNSATDAPTSPGLDVYAQPQRLVKLPDGRRMNIYCLGTGSPTVILEGGWTTDTLAMRGMQAPIAAFTRALVVRDFARVDVARRGIDGRVHERSPSDDLGEIARHRRSTPQRSCQWAKPARQGTQARFARSH